MLTMVTLKDVFIETQCKERFGSLIGQHFKNAEWVRGGALARLSLAKIPDRK